VLGGEEGGRRVQGWLAPEMATGDATTRLFIQDLDGSKAEGVTSTGTLLPGAMGTSLGVLVAWARLVGAGMPEDVCSFHRGEEL